MSNFNGLIKKVNSMQAFAAVLGVGLAIVSTVFTVKLMVSFGNSGFEKVLYGAFGILIQSAQTALYVYAAYCYWVLKDFGKALPGFALFVMLFFLSLAGSIGSFVVSNRTQNVAVEKTSQNLSSYDADIAALDKQIESLNKQLEGLSAKGVATASRPVREQIDRLTEQREALSESKRSNNAVRSADDPDALYKIIGEFFGINPTSAKMLLFTLYSVALELASVILLSYSIGMFGGDVAVQDIVRQDNRQREAGFVPPSEHAPAMARYREPEPEYESPPAPRKKNIGFVMEKPEHVRSQSQHEFPNRDDVLDALQSQLAELMAKEKARTEAARPSIPPAASKEEAVADKILDSLTSTSTGNSTSTGIPVLEPVTSTGIKQKIPVSVPDEEDGDDMDIDVIISDYVEALFPVKPDGSLTGRALACKKLGISEDIGRLIHLRLKKAGVIRVDGSKTFPECTKSEMIERMAV